VIEILAGLAIVLALLWFGQRGLIYFPDSHVPDVTAVGLPSADPVEFETEDGLRLAGWFVAAVTPSTGYTVIVFNGNAGDRGDRAQLGAQLAARGVAVFLFDYRGYGGNPGLPSERGLARDARAALACIGRRPDVDARRLVFFGESLGAAVAVRLAIEFPPAALALRSPFASLASVGKHHYPFLPVRWLLRDRYPTINRIAGIQSSLLVVAGDADQVVPVGESEAVFNAAPYPKRLVILRDADHNDPELASGPALVRAVLDLLSAEAGHADPATGRV
jgi:fermentation-respiration switch protein FrsA (DUF1100 family)